MASTGAIVNPDSVLARTAREMVEAHAGGGGPREGMTACPVCGEPLPCPSGPIPWTRVWVPGDHTFGRYGDVPFAGVPGCEAATEEFARARAEDAVAATRSVVRYVLALVGDLPESQAIYEP